MPERNVAHIIPLGSRAQSLSKAGTAQNTSHRMTETKKILLVDSRKDFRDLWGGVLTAEGYQVFLARDGEDGVKKADEIVPDLIISDVLMPKMSGNDFYKEVRKRYYGKDIPFLVVLERPKMKDYFDTIGVTNFIQEPVTKEALLSKVQSALAGPGPEMQPERNRRVLVVGRYEKECVQEMISQLKEEGCHTDFVVSGEQVVSKAIMFLPRIILIESRMPDMSSNAVVRILRQMPQFKKIPILIYSFYHKSELKIGEDENTREANMQYFVQECLEAGATKYLGPYIQGAFKDKVKRYLTEGVILIIDDDEGIVHLLKKSLEGKGYAVFAASDANSGFELAKNINPSLIVLDVVMPKKDGFEALKDLKTTPSTKDIPVVMLTVQGGDGDIQKGLKLGVEDYLVKPVNTSLFLKRVQTILKAR